MPRGGSRRGCRFPSEVAMSWLFLLVSLVGAWLTYNAYHARCTRRARRAAISFFAGWLTSELALHHIAWQAVMTLVFIRAGALHAWPGRLGLLITLRVMDRLVALLRAQPRGGDRGRAGAARRARRPTTTRRSLPRCSAQVGAGGRLAADPAAVSDAPSRGRAHPRHHLRARRRHQSQARRLPPALAPDRVPDAAADPRRRLGHRQQERAGASR